MAAVKKRYKCTACGFTSPNALGRCPECGSFGTLKLEEQAVSGATGKALSRTHTTQKAKRLSEVESVQKDRYQTGLKELDAVLGGGLVHDSAVLIGGDPGIGKSTLLLQVCDALSSQGKVLYISGEESESQIEMRARRLKVNEQDIYVCSENDLEKIVSEIDLFQPDVVIIDSIQTIYSPQIQSAPGSMSQIRECTAVLVSLAKSRQAAVFIVGHVTKEGAIAGPKVLEHLVDTVLYFEGDMYESFRVLRCQKNRFGSTNEIGVFEMTADGFQEVPDPSGVFLSHSTGESGCCVSCIVEGTRALLLETQALVSPSSLPTPRVASIGLDRGRLSQLMAVMEKKCDVQIAGKDVYANLVGGIKAGDPSLDLAIIGSLFSSITNRPVKEGMIAVGEVTLTGEIRRVQQIEKRIQEAVKLGFSKVMVPVQNFSAIDPSYKQKGVEIIPVATVAQALRMFLEPVQ